MLTVDEALQRILETVSPFTPQPLQLADALGLVLAEEIVSETDSPPFDKSLMDGYAVRAADVTAQRKPLTVVEEITAGRVPTHEITTGEAARIMTGAPIPPGADTVIRSEDTKFDESSYRVTVRLDSAAVGGNLMKRGTTMRRGETVLPGGRVLRPQELGALAEMGQAEVVTRRRPRAAILATGDELVPVGETPGPGQIRNSNETLLTAQVQRSESVAVPLGIARDDREHLRRKIHDGLQNDVLLLSGGVSAGKLDLVPAELEAAGVRQVFHKVKVKPGKPVWFGLRNAAAGSSSGPCYVFGLPGNPVSSMVCFEIFARTALRRLMGHPEPLPKPVSATLQHKFSFRGDRQTYHPCQLEWTNSGPTAKIGTWHGSADLRSTVETNGLAVFTPGETDVAAGDQVNVIPW